jgi:copper chaperone NosL
MKNLLFISISVIILSCNPKPHDIQYGEESCVSCSMTIVDKNHGAQIVTTKNKVYNFDSIECMVQYTAEFDSEKVGLLLVTDFNKPEELIDASKAHFIVSENIPSPMGAYLSAVENKKDAEELRNAHTGELYSWETIKELINK